MFEKFLSNNAHDFRQRYQGTFGFFCNNHDKKPPMLCKIGFVEEELVFCVADTSEQAKRSESTIVRSFFIVLVPTF